MKLYYAPGACSLADHIALHEANLAFDRVKVDLKAKTVEGGGDYLKVNPKGYVPALVLDDGQVLTENIAILSWVADQAPALAPTGDLARYRLLETLAYVSTEIHKAFKPFFNPKADEAQKADARSLIEKRLGLIAERLTGDYLFGSQASVADAYLFVMLRWAQANGVALSAPLKGYYDRMSARPAVRLALEHEGLPKAA
jgi:glutathione S-transferase